MEMRTIQAVDPETRAWRSPQGQDINYINGQFADGENWTVGVSERNTPEVLQRLRGLVGVPAHYQLQHKEVRNDVNVWKLADYPGKPQGQIPYPGSNGGGAPPASPRPSAPTATTATAAPPGAGPAYDPTVERFSIEAQGSRSSIERVLCAAIEAKLPIGDATAWLDLLISYTPKVQGAVRRAATADPTEATSTPSAASSSAAPSPSVPSGASTPATTSPPTGNASSNPSDDPYAGPNAVRTRLVDEALRIYSNAVGIANAWLALYGDERGVVSITLPEITDDELREIIGG